MAENWSLGILGAGSIGCFIGAHLLRAGSPTTLVGRPKLQACLQKKGLHITKAGGEEFRIPPQAINVSASVDALRDCEVVFVCVKSGDTASAAQQLAALWDGPVPPKIQAIVSLQNGIHNADLLRQGLPAAAKQLVIAGMVPYNVNWLPEGHFHCGTSGDLIIADQPPALTESIRQILVQAGLATRTHPRIDGILWGKLLVNLNNPLNALSNLPLKQELLDRRFRRILADLMSEGLDVLKSAGVTPINPFGVHPRLVPRVLRLPTPLFRLVAARMISIDPEARSSMWQDLCSGRPTEIDFINGEIVALAESVNQKAPWNAGIVRLIKEREKKKDEARVQTMPADIITQGLRS